MHLSASKPFLQGKIKKSKSYDLDFFGAGGRTRTGTLSPAVDCESTTSANSITPACDFHNAYLLYYNLKKKASLFLKKIKFVIKSKNERYTAFIPLFWIVLGRKRGRQQKNKFLCCLLLKFRK